VTPQNADVNAAETVRTINEIIAIENAAQELIKKAERERGELPAKISAGLDEYETRSREDALEKIKNIRASEESQTKEKTDKIYAGHADKLARLKQITDENIDSWVDRIYASVIAPTEI